MKTVSGRVMSGVASVLLGRTRRRWVKRGPPGQMTLHSENVTSNLVTQTGALGAKPNDLHLFPPAKSLPLFVLLVSFSPHSFSSTSSFRFLLRPFVFLAPSPFPSPLVVVVVVVSGTLCARKFCIRSYPPWPGARRVQQPFGLWCRSLLPPRPLSSSLSSSVASPYVVPRRTASISLRFYIR